MNQHEPIKVVILLQDLEFGGSQRYAIHLARHLDRERFSTELWVLRGGTDLLPLARQTGANILWMSNSPWVGPRALIGLASTLRERTPEILLTLTVVPNIWGQLLGKLMKIPVIISTYRNPFPKQYESLLWRLSSRIICNAEALRNEILVRHGVDSRRVVVTPNAVNADLFSPDDSGRAAHPTVVNTGRLVNRKDPLTLLEGFKIATQHHPAARLEIIGNGEMKTKLEERISRYSLESKVRLLPGTVEVTERLRRAWVFAMTPRIEASPNAIVEAMATGLPVVATRVGGIPELIEDGRTGLLVDPEDPGAVAEALTELLNDEPRRRTMGLRARDKAVATHSMERRIRDTQNLLIEALEETGRTVTATRVEDPTG